MLLNYANYCYLSYLVLSLILWACAEYAYRVNSRRTADDPDRKNYHPMAVHLVPITWPLLLSLLILFFVVRALLYGVFLVLFTFALMVFRRPFLLIWLQQTARRIGDRLNEANTFLIRFLFGDWGGSPQPS